MRLGLPRLGLMAGCAVAAAVAATSAVAQAPDPGAPAAGGRAETPDKPAAKAAPTLPARPPRPARKAALADKDLVSFENAPFPYDGMIPEQNKPFLEHDADGAYHLAPRAGKLRPAVYADRRSLVFVPPRFDPRREDARLILFFHGNLATLGRDVVARQRVPEQLAASRLNAALVAPQMASDANDSSAGRFWNAGFLDAYLHEAAQHLAERSHGAFAAEAIDRLPVIIVAYSGGYLPAAFSLLNAGKGGADRIEGVVLLDALFGEDAKFADWIQRPHQSPFFVSLYSKASSGLNLALIGRLEAAGIAVEHRLPAHVGPGTIAFEARPSAVHNDFMTRAGSADPLADVLRRLTGTTPAASGGADGNRADPEPEPPAGQGDAAATDDAGSQAAMTRKAAKQQPVRPQPAKAQPPKPQPAKTRSATKSRPTEIRPAAPTPCPADQPDCGKTDARP